MNKYPKFEDIKVSTKTFTANTNLVFDLEKIYNNIPITDYTITQKKRGRKKKDFVPAEKQVIAFGSIITLKYEGNIKGVELKPSKKNKSWFRNSITVVMMMDKPINFKICRSGTFQMTGCKTWSHAESCIKEIWKYIKDIDESHTFSTVDNNILVYVIPSMRNIDFDLGFNVDRGKFNKYMNQISETHCLLETSFGYTGVSVKFPLTENRGQMGIKKLQLENGSDVWNVQKTRYIEYLNTLPEKTKEKKLEEPKFNTFLVFHSGKVILSGVTSDFMRKTYYRFLDLVNEGYDHITEKLEK